MPKEFNKRLKEQFLKMQVDPQLRQKHLVEYTQLVQVLNYMNDANLYGISYSNFTCCFFEEVLGESSKDYKAQALENIQQCLDAAVIMNFINKNEQDILHITEEGVTFLEKNDVVIPNCI